MYRSEEDLALLAELAGVLDQTVAAGGLSAGTYLVLRELVRHDGVVPVGAVADALNADGNEVAELVKHLIEGGLAAAGPAGVMASDAGREQAAAVESQANEAMRAYVMDRPHTATVYGLVASMQAGRFTVEDLIAFLNEGPGEHGDDDTAT